MKNTLLIISISICQFACGQSVNESAVPVPVKNVLEINYPGSKGKWEKEDGNYEVSFRKDSKSVSLVISKTGIVLEQKQKLPKPICHPLPLHI